MERQELRKLLREDLYKEMKVVLKDCLDPDSEEAEMQREAIIRIRRELDILGGGSY